MKSWVTQHLLCFGVPWSQLFNGILVPGASAKMKFTGHGRRCVVRREALNVNSIAPVHGTGWEVSKAKLRRSWKHCFSSAWSSKSHRECNWELPLPGGGQMRRWRQALFGRCLEGMRANKVQQGKVWLHGRKKLFTIRLLWHWDRWPRGVWIYSDLNWTRPHLHLF